MARKKRGMRQIKRVLELRHEHGLSVREIARSVGLAASTVGDYLRQAAEAGLRWPLPEELGEAALHERLRGGAVESKGERPMPDWAAVRRELSRKGVTRRLLWEEYRREHPDGYRLTQFCEHYRRWLGTVDPVLRQEHPAGESLFVDWAGQTVPLHEPVSGEEREAHLFVAVLGYSNYAYAEAFLDEKLGSWITGHIHAFEAMNGVARRVVPDNPKTAVLKPSECSKMPVGPGTHR